MSHSMMAKTLTPPQLAAYWRAAAAAARNLGEPLEGYRKRAMREECGVDSVKALGRTTDFDRIMCRFAVDAGDYAAAAKYSTAAGERMAEMVRVCLSQVLQLAGCTPGTSHASDYLCGILRQAHLTHCLAPDGSLSQDVAESDLRKVFQMLDTHRRRLLYSFMAPESIRPFAAFDMNAAYELTHTGVRIHFVPSHYAR